MIYAFWAILVLAVAFFVFRLVFWIAINNGSIKLTPEDLEKLNKYLYWK